MRYKKEFKLAKFLILIFIKRVTKLRTQTRYILFNLSYIKFNTRYYVVYRHEIIITLFNLRVKILIKTNKNESRKLNINQHT